MARILIVGCGCRGRALARALREDGHAVRGTTRRPEAVAEIEAAGAEGVVADPDRLATLLPHIERVSAMCWLMGSASGDAGAVAALHGPRLASIVETLIDTHVRGVVYEASGTVDAGLLGEGAATVRRLAGRHRMPAEVVEQATGDHRAWTGAMRAAVARVLGA